MAIEITTEDGRLVAVRFYGGLTRGALVRMEVAEFEYPEWRDVRVQENGDRNFEPLGDWLSRQAAKVEWDNAARRNAEAREFESGRFATMPGADKMVAAARDRARYLARRSLTVMAGKASDEVAGPSP